MTLICPSKVKEKTMELNFIKRVEKRDSILIAEWETSSGKMVTQTWSSRPRFVGYLGDETDLGAARFLQIWEMERPFLLTGVDPEKLILWAKGQGIYTEVSKEER